MDQQLGDIHIRRVLRRTVCLCLKWFPIETPVAFCTALTFGLYVELDCVFSGLGIEILCTIWVNNIRPHVTFSISQRSICLQPTFTRWSSRIRLGTFRDIHFISNPISFHAFLLLHFFIFFLFFFMLPVGLISLRESLRRTWWPRGLRRDSAATRLLGLRVRSPLSVVYVVCWQVEDTVTGWSLVQNLSTECMFVLECEQVQQ